jgi:hypothetical protein
MELATMSQLQIAMSEDFNVKFGLLDMVGDSGLLIAQVTMNPVGVFL